MPLDMGGPELDTTEPPGQRDPLHAHPTLGLALRAIRQDRGLTVEELAEKTRVRRSYLEAIEEMRLDALPSRPFTIGYVRAYALALGLDPEAAVERFKSDEPVLDEPLRAPIGVLEERDPRMAALIASAIVIIAAIVLWNVAQRAMNASAPPPPKASDAVTWKLLADVKPGPFALGDPLPAPVESTTPPLYETPGLDQAGEDGRGNLAPPSNINELPEELPVDLATLPPTFTAKGKVYDGGSPQRGSNVTIQALKGAGLIIRGADGSVYFARQLAPGEAYKVPDLAGLTIDVSVPYDFQVFVNGQSKGLLPARQVLASKLAVAAPSAPVVVAPRPVAPIPTAPVPYAPAPSTPR